MYLRFFGLHQAPFSIAPDPQFLFMSGQHRDALAHLRYGLQSSGGFVVLSGEVGAGKTTLCRCLLEQIPQQCQVAYLFNPKLTAKELLQSVCAEFGVITPQLRSNQPTIRDHIDALNQHLLAMHARGQHCVLIVDEAQALLPALLEQLRLLTNLETNERKLLQIMLVGQPELQRMLAQPELTQLAQRVVARYHLNTLSAAETERYIRHRLAVAGMTGRVPFDGAAVRRIHRWSQGVPRRINVLCDRALLGAYGADQHRVKVRMVDQAAREVFGPNMSATWRGWLERSLAPSPSPFWARLGLTLIAAAATGLAAVAVLAWRDHTATAKPGLASSAPPRVVAASAPAIGAQRLSH